MPNTENNDLEQFLKGKSTELFHTDFNSSWISHSYVEDIQVDFDDETKLGNDDHTWIYKIACLRVIDANKLDFAHLFFGMERKPNQYVFIGYLHFPHGENDDLKKSLERIGRFTNYDFLVWG